MKMRMMQVCVQEPSSIDIQLIEFNLEMDVWIEQRARLNREMLITSVLKAEIEINLEADMLLSPGDLGAHFRLARDRMNLVNNRIKKAIESYHGNVEMHS